MTKSIGVILIFVACLGVVVLVLSNIRTTGHSSTPSMCMTNLNGIGKSICLYEAMYEAMPLDLEKLVTEGYASRKILICPGYTRNFANAEMYIQPDYVMIMAGLCPSGSALQVFELPINHNQQQVNYLLCSCGVVSIKKQNISEFITIVQNASDLLAKLRNKPEEYKNGK